MSSIKDYYYSDAQDAGIAPSIRGYICPECEYGYGDIDLESNYEFKCSHCGHKWDGD